MQRHNPGGRRLNLYHSNLHVKVQNEPKPQILEDKPGFLNTTRIRPVAIENKDKHILQYLGKITRRSDHKHTCRPRTEKP